MIELKNLNKTFTTSKEEVYAVRDVNLTIDDGEIFGIIGFSGAGKSTLVRCMNLLERPTSGEVIVDGVDLCKLSRKQLRESRKSIGMIFQQFNLLSQRTVEGNVRYPLELSGVSKDQADRKVSELLAMVGLEDKAKAYPAQLSGGQQQRVAIARALASDPKIILCDEATSALDPITTRSILDLIKSLNERLGVTVVVITHEMRVVEQICDRVAVMSSGEIQEVGSVKDVFLRPESITARKLVDPSYEQGSSSLPKNAIRLAFSGEESGDPVISDMAITCGVKVSILSANTENIGGKSFGQMVIELPSDEQSQAKVREYLRSRDIFFEEADEASGSDRADQGPKAATAKIDANTAVSKSDENISEWEEDSLDVS